MDVSRRLILFQMRFLRYSVFASYKSKKARKMPAERTRLRNLSREMREQQERGPSPPTLASQNPSNNETILGTTGIPSIARPRAWLPTLH